MYNLACFMCNNALTDDFLDDENDLSYYGLGYADKGFCIRLVSGDRKPVRIIFEQWICNQWSTVGVYYPKFCPECGRKITEYEISRRGESFSVKSEE